MAGDDQRGGGVEWLGVGGSRDDGSGGAGDSPPPGHGPRHGTRWTLLILLVVAGAVVALLVGQHHSGTPTALASSTRPGPAPRVPVVATPVIPSFPGPTPVSPAVINVKAPILGITAGYDLFASGPGAVVRIRFAAGQVDISELPLTGSYGPSAILVGTRSVLLRTDGPAAGYLLPDGGRPHRPTGALADAQLVLPGPKPDTVWAMHSLGMDFSLRLVSFSGRPGATRVSLPAGFTPAGPDGAGFVLATGPGGVYDARPGGLSRISHGTLLAAGPSGWLVRECDRHAHCGDVYIDRTSGSRHRLPADVVQHTAPGAAIAPDGRHAAFLRSDASGAPAVEIVDLVSGARRSVPLALPIASQPGQLVWSPDGRWLFAAAGGLRAVDTRTGRVSMLPSVSGGMRLTQVAIRPAR